MSSDWGRHIKISIYGESHGASVGVVLDGLPPGVPIDEEALAAFLARRSPGRDALSTPRRETDLPAIQSGLYGGRTTGTPLCAVIANADARSGDYEQMRSLARPGHADHTGYIRYAGYGDIRGGGHFSGRLTAPLTFAGGVAGQILAAQGIFIGAHIASVAGIEDTPPDPVSVGRPQLEAVTAKRFPVFDEQRGRAMQDAITAARAAGDSLGGTVACYALGVPAGLGSPMFHGLENAIASLLFGVPAVKGLEFGDGFALAAMRGSRANDPMRAENGGIVCESNHNGGILGGISNGMPIWLRAAFKPTPTISLEQNTVDYKTGQNATLAAQGRHDPCIVHRAVPVVEACVALAILDAGLEGGNPNGFKRFA